MSLKLITIFTPTYNRAYCLPRLYDSLKNQSLKDFVWLIVDDGSTDDTSELVDSFVSDDVIDIKYVKQPNSGKHVAHNLAVDLCETELFMCVDSDDDLTLNAVETISRKYAEVKKENILGLYFRRVNRSTKKIIGPDFPARKRVGITDLYNKMGFWGDTAIVLLTKKIKGHHFPVFEGEKFVTESVFYNDLNPIAPMALFNEGIYLFEYLPDGYTSNTERLLINNPYGTALANLYEAYYGNKCIYRAKNYSQYLALVDLFELDRGKINGPGKQSVVIRIAGRMLKAHYIKLFDRYRKDYAS